MDDSRQRDSAVDVRMESESISDAQAALEAGFSSFLDTEHVSLALFYREVFRLGCRRLHLANWPTQADLPNVAEAEERLRIRGINWHYAVMQMRGCPVFIELGK